MSMRLPQRITATYCRPLLVVCIAIGLGEAGWAADVRGNTNTKSQHWAFQPLAPRALPRVEDPNFSRTAIDLFVQATLEKQGLKPGARADRATLLRRLSFDLTGLPPTPDQVAEWLADTDPDAVSRWVDQLLASPDYGERWAKYWLDAVGYADSNGYFHADTDRPLAHKYRDYVIRSFCADLPFDQFVREQLAGDEMARHRPGTPLTARMRELFTATHFLRNGQDGTGESDGNPDERTIDRATVLEGTLQITMNSLLGITIQCARCHEHKFEPIEHREYYSLQSIFYPAFPAFHADKWVAPKDRIRHVATPQELANWRANEQRIDAKVAQLRQEFGAWLKTSRPPGKSLFRDDFESDALAANWTNTVPGDDSPGGTPAINVGAPSAPGAVIKDAQLRIIESGSKGDRWLSSKRRFDWTPDHEGAWIQATFDLVDDKLSDDGKPAERIAFCLALHDFNDSSDVAGGNILIDGNPAGGAAIHLDYPGDDSKHVGNIGTSGYRPGHNFGVRITNVGDGKFQLEQLVDWQPEEKTITLSIADLPDGALGFEYCCGRSFVVDNVVVETSTGSPAEQEFVKQHKRRREQLDKAVKQQQAQRTEKPGALAMVSDIAFPVPDVFVLERGDYSARGRKVEPAGLDVLSVDDAKLDVQPSQSINTSGRRLAFANWLTKPQSRSSALLARVMVNRIWQYHFGVGLVRTADNFGLSGARPSHPQLLEYLAGEFVRSGWSVKTIHRMICNSAVYQQTSRSDNGNFVQREDAAPRAAINVGRNAIPSKRISNPSSKGGRLLSQFPIRRLDAEALRDGMLLISGELDRRRFGSYVPTKRQGDGNVIVATNDAGARRRSTYVQQRRTQVHTLLHLFDAPSMANACATRSPSNVPLQSLALLNSTFVRARSVTFADRLQREAGSRDRMKYRHALLWIAGRGPTKTEWLAAERFLNKQREVYAGHDDVERRVWTDLCQMLLASNQFLYVE